MDEPIWLVAYLIAVPFAAIAIGYFDPPIDTEEQMQVGAMALAWPLLAPIAVIAGAVWCVGWFGRKAGQR